MGLNKDIAETIDILKQSDIIGCITGSCMIPEADFESWPTVPDVDVFVYQRNGLLYACDYLMMKHGFQPLNEGEGWKIDRVRRGKFQQNKPLTTVKLRHGEAIVNITWKKGRQSLCDVLQSFDMSIIMRGYDIERGYLLDLRCGWPGMVDGDTEHRWSDSPWKAVPNPMRNQDFDMYTVAQWVRQFDRVIKYAGRGFDTTEMARFYIEGITAVIEKGSLFSTERSTELYESFVKTYQPIKERMVEWLKQYE